MKYRIYLNKELYLPLKSYFEKNKNFQKKKENMSIYKY